MWRKTNSIDLRIAYTIAPDGLASVMIPGHVWKFLDDLGWNGQRQALPGPVSRFVPARNFDHPANQPSQFLRSRPVPFKHRVPPLPKQAFQHGWQVLPLYVASGAEPYLIAPAGPGMPWSSTSRIRTVGGGCAPPAPISADSRTIYHPTGARGLIQFYCENVARATRAALEGTIDMFYVFYVPIHDEVGRGRVPTLIMIGENDPLLGPDYARQFVLSSAPGARMVVMPCNNEIPIDMPRETAWILEAFLSGLQSISGIHASA